MRNGFTLIEILLVMAIVGTLSAIAVPKFHDAVDKAKVARAIEDISALQADVIGYAAGHDSLPVSLVQAGRGAMTDPWGNLYRYVRFDPKGGVGQARKDRFLVPINSDFDLYSMGKDGQSAPGLTAKPSRDDIIRANDGSFIGLASNY
jgi:general secretion pathway protein G